MNKHLKAIRQQSDPVDDRIGMAYIPILLSLLVLLMSCQKVPHVASAADPTALRALKPMGSATSNAELEKKLANITPTLPKEYLSRQIQLAEFYFNERRFIESAHLLSRILDADPTYPTARNLLARCFYFLGNPDRTLQELEYIVLNQKSDANEFMDALYLMGAAVKEGQLASEKSVQKAIGAWEAYLRIAGKTAYGPEIKAALPLLKKRLQNVQAHHHKKGV